MHVNVMFITVSIFFSLKTVFFCKVHVINRIHLQFACTRSLSIQLFKPPLIQLVMSLPEHPGDCPLLCEGQAGIGWRSSPTGAPPAWHQGLSPTHRGPASTKVKVIDSNLSNEQSVKHLLGPKNQEIRNFFSQKSGGYQEFFSIKSNNFIQNYK